MSTKLLFCIIPLLFYKVYSLIILQGILPWPYLNNYFLFVWRTNYDLMKAKVALDFFIVKMEEHYGIGSCTFNIHQLSHLARSTEMCGPLWAVSTFTFEGNNSTLKKMIQGTQYVSDQVCQTYAIMKTLPVIMKQNI